MVNRKIRVTSRKPVGSVVTIDGDSSVTPAELPGNDEGDSGVSGEDQPETTVEFTEPTGGSTGGNGVTESESPRRRGRPPGSGAGTGKRKPAASTFDLGALLYSTHLMLARITQAPEFALPKEEAEELGKALKTVQDLYDVSVIPEKTLAWINLFNTGAAIYGPRYFAIHARHKREARAKQATPLTPMQIVQQGGTKVG